MGKPVYMYSMGGLAEFCVVPANALSILPNSLPYTESAILGCAVFTAYGAMAHAAEVRPGDAIAVIGIGGEAYDMQDKGIHKGDIRTQPRLWKAISIARAFGASEIIAVDVQDEKLQKAKMLGATHIINARNEDAVQKIREMIAHLPLCSIESPKTVLVAGGSYVGILKEISHYSSMELIDICEIDEMVINVSKKYFPELAVGFEDPPAQLHEITGGMGVDIAVEALGKPQTFMQCTQSVRDGGKAVMIGLTLSDAKGEIDINRLVRRQIKVIGSYGARARHDLPKVIKLAETGIFDLTAAVSRKCKFEEAGKAYEDLNQGSIVGRAVVEIM
ncbi:unnamed protein product [Ilex paraguariensis]|uniref:PABS domain-containing protein n=1 Tax=Ilex paraguariensis TaxID=185542 RepID=A0ABC8T2P9_9AQUA